MEVNFVCDTKMKFKADLDVLPPVGAFIHAHNRDSNDVRYKVKETQLTFINEDNCGDFTKRFLSAYVFLTVAA